MESNLIKISDKSVILALIISKLETDIATSAQAVEMARDTATHKDCLGSSKYETMGLEASYLAQGQGTRLLELERCLAYFKQIKLQASEHIALGTYITLGDEDDKKTWLWVAADAGGLTIDYQQQTITIITPKSPLGKALLGKIIGDEITLKMMGNEKTFEVLDML